MTWQLIIEPEENGYSISLNAPRENYQEAMRVVQRMDSLLDDIVGAAKHAVAEVTG